jgi:flagellar basal body-associated protein FliL
MFKRFAVIALLACSSAMAAPIALDASSIVPLVFTILIIAAVAGGAFYVVTRKKKERAEDKTTISRNERNSALLEFSERLDDATRIVKAATYNDAQKRQVLDRIQSLQVYVRTMLIELKEGKEVSSVRISYLESYVNTIIEQASIGLSPVSVSAPKSPPSAEPHPMPRRKETEYRTQSPTPAPQVIPAPLPGPIVAPNDEMMTAVMLGSLLTGILLEEATKELKNSSDNNKN